MTREVTSINLSWFGSPGWSTQNDFESQYVWTPFSERIQDAPELRNRYNFIDVVSRRSL